jgi:hypothetical protein
LKPVFKPDPNLIYRISDNGYTAGGDNASRFPSATEIILDSRGVIFDKDGNPGCCTSNPAETPLPGSPVYGPFLQDDTKVVKIEPYGMPSNPYVIGSLLTVDKPIVGKSEWKGMVFLYTFPRNYKPAPPPTIAPPSSTECSGTRLNYVQGNDVQSYNGGQEIVVERDGGFPEPPGGIGYTMTGDNIEPGTTVVSYRFDKSNPSSRTNSIFINMSKPLRGWPGGTVCYRP